MAETLTSTPDPLGRAEFADLMERLGPFERKPEIAVAVSGGADSMAAAVLTHEWATALGGRALGVTLDHGLRHEAADEALLVSRRLSALGIESSVLKWRGEKPAANIQAAARAARYQALTDYCARKGILHLVLGHHREDQAETFLMRLSRGSGLYGLAAMSPLQENPHHRILRPFLSVPKRRLVATLQVRGVEWVEDPTNQDLRYDRVRVRRLLPLLAADGLSSSRLARSTQRLAEARTQDEAMTSAALARAVAIHPTGIALADPEVLRTCPRDIALRCLSRLLATVSGSSYSPGSEPLEALYEALVRGAFAGSTLSGCRLVSWRRFLLLYRENRHWTRMPLVAGQVTLWDRRFEVMLSDTAHSTVRPIEIGPLRSEGWAQIRQKTEPESLGFPALAGEAVVGLWDGDKVVAVPHFGYFDRGLSPQLIAKWRFRPGISLTGGAFTVA